MFAFCLRKEKPRIYSYLKVTYSGPKMTDIDPKVTDSDPTQLPLPPPAYVMRLTGWWQPALV